MTATLDVDGIAAPPRQNGELVFAEPWEGRAFGLAMALTEAGVISYEVFREALISRIAAWEAASRPGADYCYYRCWLEALEQVLAAEDLVSSDDLVTRAADLAARPAGHDHDHDHAHGHGHDHEH